MTILEGSIRDIHAQRRRWERRRHREHLAWSTTGGFARGGLGNELGERAARVLFLPADPELSAVTLDEETSAWLRETSSDISHIPWPHKTHSVTDALIRFTQHQDDEPWSHYTALHRHGALEAGSTDVTFEYKGNVFFRLRNIVALAWTAADLQSEAIDRWSINGPFEATVALTKTRGHGLATFAEGWREPSQGRHEWKTCLDPHVLTRWELPADFSPEELAIEVGDRIENAFGSTERRHIAHSGELEGELDVQRTM